MKDRGSFWFSQKSYCRNASRLDFANEKPRRNPYFGKPEEHRTSRRRRKFLVALIVIAASVMSAVIIFHTQFQIHADTIKVTGLKRISSQKFIEAINSILSDPLFLVLPRNNYALLNTEEMRGILLRRFAVDRITILKRFPNILEIAVTEKPPVIIYDNGYAYAALDGTGSVVELIRSLTDEEKVVIATSSQTVIRPHIPAVDEWREKYPGAPVVFAPDARPMQLHAAVIEEKKVDTILLWSTFLRNAADIPVRYFILNNHGEEAFIATGEGWELRVRLADQFEAQTLNLTTALREHLLPRPNLEYVDLRFDNKLFWQ